MAHEMKARNGILLGSSSQALNEVQTTLRATGSASDTAIATELAVRTALDTIVPVSITELTTGFSIAGGDPTSKTLTVTEDATIDQNLATTASPTFSGATISGLSDGFVTATSGVIGSQATVDYGDITASDIETDLVGGTNKLASAFAIKTYVDNMAAGLDPKESCRVATTIELVATAAGTGVGKTLTLDANGAIGIDSVSLALNDRVLVKNQTTTADNGIYTVTVVGDGSTAAVLTRATDFDGVPENEVSGGSFTFIEAGTTNGSSGWVVAATGNVDVDTDPIIFVQFSEAGQLTAGEGLYFSGGNTLNIGLGDGLKTVDGDLHSITINHSANLTFNGGALDTIQNIATTDAPEFTTVTLSNITAQSMMKVNNFKAIVAAVADTDFQQVITWGDGLQYAAGTASIDLNATNMKITAGEINTIQDIDSTATPTFAGLTANGDVTVSNSGVLTLAGGLKDTNVVTAITLGDASNTALSGFTATSLVGALNEVKADIDDMEQDVIKETITQAGHGFAAGDVIRHNGTIYVKGQANNAANGEVIAVVESVSGDDFVAVYSGRITIAGASWTAGDVLYLDATTAGALTGTEPTQGNVVKPMIVATSTTSGVVVNYLGVITTITVFETNDLDASGTVVVDTFAETEGDACVWHYNVASSDGAHRRAGTITACWNATTDTVEYTEYSTTDIGNTDDISIASDISSNNVRFVASNGGTGNDWSVKVKRVLF